MPEEKLNSLKRTIVLGFDQIERALLLTNDVVSEALCEPISEELEATLAEYRKQLRVMSEIFYGKIKARKM